MGIRSGASGDGRVFGSGATPGRVAPRQRSEARPAVRAERLPPARGRGCDGPPRLASGGERAHVRLEVSLPYTDVEQLWRVAGAGFRYFDWVATLLWALTGAVLGARRGYDLTGIFAIALVSSCGGGLLRDALFLQAGPPMLVRTPTYVLITLVASLLTWWVGGSLHGRVPKAVLRLTALADALGLGAFAVVGMRLSLAASISVAGAMLVGVVNAVGGGVLRSLLLHRTPLIFRPGELTALAAFAGTLLYGLLALALKVDDNAAGFAAIALVVSLHWASRRYRLQTRAAWSEEVRQRRRSWSK